MNQMAAFDEQVENYEQLSDEELDEKMNEIEAEIHRQTEVILDILGSDEPGSEEKARELLDQQVALNFDLAQLKDIRSSREKQKTFYDANGVEVPSAKEATFIINNDKGD